MITLTEWSGGFNNRYELLSNHLVHSKPSTNDNFFILIESVLESTELCIGASLIISWK